MKPCDRATQRESINTDIVLYFEQNAKTNKMQNSTYGFVLMTRFIQVTIRYQYAEISISVKQLTIPRPFGVITCTSSSTVTLFLPFFFTKALQKKSMKNFNFEKSHKKEMY
jgi:urea transporter